MGAAVDDATVDGATADGATSDAATVEFTTTEGVTVELKAGATVVDVNGRQRRGIGRPTRPLRPNRGGPPRNLLPNSRSPRNLPPHPPRLPCWP